MTALAQLASFNDTAPVLVIAPHLVYPLRNGADLLIDRRWAAFSVFVPYVDIIGAQEIVRYERGREVSRQAYRNTMRSKPQAALRTLMRQSNYLIEKFLTPAFTQTVNRYLGEGAYRTVVCSYLGTASLLVERTMPDDVLVLVESHNDDFKWFQTLRKASRNPMARWAVQQSENWTATFLKQYASRFGFIHVTPTDREGYRAYAPDHASLIGPVGVELMGDSAPVLKPNQYPVRLMFIGNLGVQMNHDALQHFQKVFFPSLASHFGADIEVLVVGSSPSAGVVQLCTAMNWSLHPDVSDEELERLFHSATFTVLPFSYATGAKLKLLNSLAHSIPFLATEHVQAQVADELPPGCLLANNPLAWVSHVQHVVKQGISTHMRQALRSAVRPFTWAHIAQRLHNDLKNTL